MTDTASEPKWLAEETADGTLKTIADGFAQYGYRQGTRECIAFHRGILYALARAAEPSKPEKHWAADLPPGDVFGVFGQGSGS